VHGCTVTGGDSFRAWYELREVQPLSGWWPFLSGDLPLAAIEVGQWSSGGDLLKQGQQIDAEEWLRSRALASADVLVDLPEARGSFQLMTLALTAQARSVGLALRWVETPQMSDSLRAQLPWLISDRLKDEISSGLP
jgi:hypothetical protein